MTNSHSFFIKRVQSLAGKKRGERKKKLHPEIEVIPEAGILSH